MRKRSLIFRARILALEQRWNPEVKEISMDSIRAQGAALARQFDPSCPGNIELDRRELDKSYRKSARILVRNPAL
jgi:hypothetical protein